MTPTTVSLFCGAGGESEGKRRALASLGIRGVTSYAVNHWDLAVATHQANHRNVKAIKEDITHVTAATFGLRRIQLLWASPSCVHHSRARSGRPKSDQQRAHADEVLNRWLRVAHVDVFLMENVVEFMEWGPLDEEGAPIRARRGEDFNRFIEDLRGLGYRVEWRVLCAADYGDPTIRRRFFLQAVRDGHPIVWPEPTHHNPADASLFNKHLRPWRTAGGVIDWGLPVPSIFSRKKPLAGATLRRIAAGIHRYILKGAPFIVNFRGTGITQVEASPSGLSEPLRPISTSGAHHALVAPFLSVYHGSNSSGAKLQHPMPTITTRDRCGLVAATLIQTGYGERPGQSPRCMDINRPLGTVVAGGGKHGLVAAFLIKHFTGVVGADLRTPLPTVTGTDHNGLVVAPISVDGQQYVIEDIGMRMLAPHELARAMGFPDSYQWVNAEGRPLTKRDQVKMIGNACPVGTVEALVTAVLSVRPHLLEAVA